MSMSKMPRLCIFCEKDKALYKCPNCNAKYCSSKCFSHRSHSDCSETFYQKWVMSSLQNQRVEASEKEKTMEMLKRVAAEDDDAEAEDEASSLEARFSDIDLSKDVEELKIWGRLTQEEQDSFKKLLADESKVCEIFEVVQPWWIAENVNVVEDPDTGDGASPVIAKRPPLPIGIKSLEALTTKPPSDCIQFNILNVLYSYTCLVRLYNNDLTDFIEDVVDSVLCLSPVFSENKNYFCLDEVVQDSLRRITTSEFKLDMNFAKSLSYDVCCIINGPTNARPHSYVICALSDIKTLFLYFKEISKESDSWKNVKKLVLPAVRKLDYFLSWSIDYHDKNLRPLSDQIKVKYFAEIVSDSFLASEAKSHSPMPELKEEPNVLIEELN